MTDRERAAGGSNDGDRRSAAPAARARPAAAATPDTLEARDPAAREADLLARLPSQIRAAQAVPAYAERLAGVDADAVRSRAALARLPVLRKGDLLAQQQASRDAGGDPFGGYSAIGWRALGTRRTARRVFQSPGPIYEPEPPADDAWRAARALRAAGFAAGDLVHNSFGYHLGPGAWIMDSGAAALGCTVFPGGVGNTELQLQAMLDLRPDGYVGTPSFLRILTERADAAGVALAGLTKALVSGEAFPATLQGAFAARGIDAYQAYATADVGLIAYETRAREGLVVDEDVLVEIVRPGTGEPVPDGEVGEVVVTVLGADYPLLRFGTGDLSAVLPGGCPTGRTNVRIRGWLGRADQTAKVRGQFVHPTQVAQLLARHAEVVRARLVVAGEAAADTMTLVCECAAPGDALRAAIAETARELTRLRCDVDFVAPGSLPNDGKVVDDRRAVG